MRKFLFVFLCFLGLTTGALAQEPVASPATPSVTQSEAIPTVPVAPSALNASSLSEGLIAEALTARVADRVQQRQDYYWGIAVAVGAVFLGLFTFIGLGQVGDIRKNVRDAVLQDLRNELAGNAFFQESVAARIRGGLANEIEAQNERLQRDIKSVRLQVLSERALSDERVDQNDRAALRDDLFSLASFPDIVSSPAYRRALKNATDFFFQRGFSKEIDSLDDLLGKVICADRENLQPMIRMMQHYGQRVIGCSDEIEPGQETIDRFLRYANALKANRYFEESAHYVLAWELLKQKPGWEGRNKSVWQDVIYFHEREKSDLFDNIEFCSDIARQSPRPGPVHYKLSSAFGALREKYPEQIAALKTAFDEMRAKKDTPQ
jgi:hypothetical protein